MCHNGECPARCWFPVFTASARVRVDPSLVRELLSHGKLCTDQRGPEVPGGAQGSAHCHSPSCLQSRTDDLPAYFPSTQRTQKRMSSCQSTRCGGPGPPHIPRMNFGRGVNVWSVNMTPGWNANRFQHLHCSCAYFPYEVACGGQGICTLRQSPHEFPNNSLWCLSLAEGQTSQFWTPFLLTHVLLKTGPVSPQQSGSYWNGSLWRHLRKADFQENGHKDRFPWAQSSDKARATPQITDSQ